MLNKVCLIMGFTVFFAISSLAQGDIRRVDFKNFTYVPFCAGEETQKVTVKNGQFSSEKKVDDFIDRFYFDVFSITYGDLNGDKKDEAIILSVCNTGGTGNFTEGFIYTIKAGKPFLLARIPGGDRAIGGLISADVEKGLLIVDQNDPERNQASCCSEYSLLSKYRLNGKKLLKVGKSISSEIYPSERVNFAKGTTKKTFKVGVDNLKRFKINAKTGQTLVVSFTAQNAANISIRLVRGEANITEGEQSLSAQLKANGDFIIEIQNTYKLPSEVTLTIEIR